MTVQSDDRRHSPASNLCVQFGLATAVAIIVIVFASRCAHRIFGLRPEFGTPRYS
jgi:hypothetical protein